MYTCILWFLMPPPKSEHLDTINHDEVVTNTSKEFGQNRVGSGHLSKIGSRVRFSVTCFCNKQKLSFETRFQLPYLLGRSSPSCQMCLERVDSDD